MLTVVAKLFGLVRPDVAVFGQKDYQQLVLIRRMVDDLCLGVEIVGAETQREPDGLALSSRNRYLDDGAAAARRVVLSRALRARPGRRRARRRRRARGRPCPAAHGRTWSISTTSPSPTPDLDALPGDLPAGTEARILVAARVGSTRLIDNLPLTIGRPD